MGAEPADVEARLLKMLEITNDRLKYAEAKNGDVVGLVSAGTTGTLTVLNELTGGTDPAATGAVVVLVLTETVARRYEGAKREESVGGVARDLAASSSRPWPASGSACC